MWDGGDVHVRECALVDVDDWGRCLDKHTQESAEVAWGEEVS